MTTEITWVVTQTNYDIATGFITTAHWSCRGVDGAYSGSVYSTCSWQAGTPTIPYAQVTQAEVLNWIWSSGVDKAATEAAVAAQVELQKNPVQASGLPWSQ